MVEGTDSGPRSATMLKKRKKGVKKFRGGAKKMKVVPGTAKKNKVNPKMQKLFRRRAREYNSDDDENENENENEEETKQEGFDGEMGMEGNEGVRSDDDDMGEEGGSSDEEGGEGKVQTGVMKFVEGCKAFRVAFESIMKSRTDDETLGPVLSAKKKLVVSKLAEEEAEKKAKGEAKKEKHLIEEKGHVKPENFLDTHEKFLIGIATKGVVKLFNAVNKAQNAQKGLNPSRFKDAKVALVTDHYWLPVSGSLAPFIAAIEGGKQVEGRKKRIETEMLWALTKRRKEAFHSELSRTSAPSADNTTKTSTHKGGEDSNQPAWAPLRDTFMLTNSKMKDWDKMAEQTEIRSHPLGLLKVCDKRSCIV